MFLQYIDNTIILDTFKNIIKILPLLFEFLIIYSFEEVVKNLFFDFSIKIKMKFINTNIGEYKRKRA